MLEHYGWWLLFFPLLGVIVNAFFSRRLGKKLVGWVACGAVGLSFVVALSLLWGLTQMPAHLHSISDTLFTWIAVGDFEVQASLLLDPLSVLMATVVTGVGFLIHLYSVGYMADDERYGRYFTFLNLFVLSMLILVLGDNFLLMYVGWEAVGLCSYLLIGFWFEKPRAAEAGKKAFIVNRIGDFGFALGVMLIFFTFRTLDFHQVFEAGPALLAGRSVDLWGLTVPLATVITLLLFAGATGKSAQIPLFVWLPDAMEGPTPVSALIHAATMVTAGVYMVARTHVLFELAPFSMGLVAIVGAATAFLAATIALTQHDIKRVLAYSTISQLGYMFLAVGVGAYAAGIFHLTTHAFFKALLFLGAGSVTHALAGELDIRKMGGLKDRIKTTYQAFILGAAALAGVPLFSGFFSKDEILWRAFNHSRILWGVGLFTALLTAFYIFRVVFVAFWGESRVDEKIHVHESPPVMTRPLVILAVLSFVGGYVGLPHLSLVDSFLGPVFEGTGHHPAADIGLEWILLAVSAVVALVGIGLAYLMYVSNPALPKAISQWFNPIYKLLYNKYYVDEIYMWAIVNPLRRLAAFLADIFDTVVFDGLVESQANLVGVLSATWRELQTGVVRNYALGILIGAVFIIGYMLLR